MYVIEKGVKGRAWKITLDVETEKQALAELALFERDPEAYRTRGQTKRAPGFTMDADTLGDFAEASGKAAARGELSETYVNYTLRPYLVAWAQALDGKPLRDVTLEELRTHLDTWPTATHKRIVALKAFTSWARERGKLPRKDDPTLDLMVPPVVTRPVGDRELSADQVAAFYSALRNYVVTPGWGPDAPPDAHRMLVDLQPLRDIVVLRTLCGMHGTEITRLAEGKGRIRVLHGEGEIAATIIFPHKRGGEHVVSIGAQALAAAQRLQAAGRTPTRVATSRAMARLAERAPEFADYDLERLRHTFVTLGAGGRVVTARGGGVPIELLSQVTNHTSTATTKRYYLGVHIPPMVVLPVTLVNEDDPR